MTGSGIIQIASSGRPRAARATPSALYMARVYTGTLRLRAGLRAPERGFYRLVGTRRGREQDWKAYARTVLIFMRVFSVLLYVLLRLQGHLLLNPDDLAAVARTSR